MRKPRDDSTWSQLTAEQRDTLEGWLFDENLGYEKTVARAQSEFGLETTIASVGRFYRRRARERQVEELVEAQAAADELNALPVSAESLRAAALKLVGKAVLRLVSEQPGRLDQLASLTRLLLDSEDNDIRRGRLRLAERCFDYDAIADSQKDLPQLRAYLAVIGEDTSLSHDEKINRVHAILYGWDRARTGANGQDRPDTGN
jgi:hypothetical protein